jgi:hypothetical protein
MKFKLLIPVLITLILLTGCQSATTAPTTNPKQTLVAPTSIPSAVEIPTNSTTILLYSVNLKGPLTSIPYYSNGEISSLPDSTFKQFKEGHLPWFGDSFNAAVKQTANLTSDQVAGSANVNNAESNTLHSKQGVTIKRLDKNVFMDGEERKAEYEISVPSVGKYNITVEKPTGTDIFFITKITLQILKGCAYPCTR